MSKPQVKMNAWPGFVAAVSGLVASLMLLLSILVLLVTQLGTLASNYAEQWLAERLRQAAEREAVEALEKIRGTGVGTGLGGAETGLSPFPTDPRPQISEVVLIFGADANDIAEEKRQAIADALRDLAAAPQARWSIVASAPESDRVARRSTFRLMVVARNFVVSQGIAESRIEMRLEDGPVATGPAPEGSIIVRIVPSRIGQEPGGPKEAPVVPAPVPVSEAGGNPSGNAAATQADAPSRPDEGRATTRVRVAS